MAVVQLGKTRALMKDRHYDDVKDFADVVHAAIFYGPAASCKSRGDLDNHNFLAGGHLYFQIHK